MAESVLRTRSKEFAKSIILLCRKLRRSGVENSLTVQLQRAGTSVGANIHEAQYAQGKKDFVSKLKIALKECNESEYWFELLNEVNSISGDDYEHFRKECVELCRMIVASINTIEKQINDSGNECYC